VFLPQSTEWTGFLICVTVNGDSRQFDHPLTCAGLVTALGLAGKRVALERNGEIVPRSALDAQPLANGDKIEIVVAVGGG
jgi:sulfur carrier protein